MARGWESKSVESQQDEARRDDRGHTHRPLSEEERARLQRRRTLELARARTAADLTRALTPAQRLMLKRALDALDAELQTLRS
jgi:hypothetical protein